MRILRSRERGYSLAEMLTVVAIIGILALVAVPNFMSMYRSGKLKTSMRQFTNHLRAARQRAVTQSNFVRVSFVDNGRMYYLFESEDQGATWDLIVGDGTNPRYIDETVHFETTGANKFTDSVDDGGFGDLPDIVFDRTGVARVPTGRGEIILKSQFDAADIFRADYTITVRSSGSVSVN